MLMTQKNWKQQDTKKCGIQTIEEKNNYALCFPCPKEYMKKGIKTCKNRKKLKNTLKIKKLKIHQN